MDPNPQKWKSQEKELRKEGRFATIMRAYVNKTTQPQHQIKPIRVPKSPLAARTRRPKFTRDERHRGSLRNKTPPPVIKSEPSPLEVSAAHGLAQQSFAAKQILFNDFPVPKKGAMSSGLEYFLRVCAPPALGQSPGWDWRNGVQSEYTVWYIQTILRSDILFELVAAYAVALRVYLQANLEGSRARQAVAFHTQNALARLRKRLLNENAHQDDAVVWAVVMLCGTTYILKELDAFKAHAHGLRQMITLRGGVDALDKFGFLKRRFINIESSLFATLEHQQNGMLATTKLIYHQPPYPNSMLQKLNNFPPGFAELPFKISLSENLIDFIGHNLEGIRHPPQGISQINGVHVTDWILSFPLPKHERLIAVALLTNALCQDRLRRAQTSAVSNYRVQKEFSRLIQFQPPVEADYVSWALLTLQGTVRFSPELRAWVNELLEHVLLTQESIAQLEARYLPITRLPSHLERQPDEL